MKRLLIGFVFLVLVSMLIAADAPPQLPSSFWGYVTGGRVGQVVTVSVNGQVRAQTTTVSYQGKVVYSMDVPMDGIADGTLANFRVGGIVAGSARLYSGTNKQLDLRASYLWLRR
jgi:hypothetical protein